MSSRTVASTLDEPANPFRIVAVGGGTGLSALLHGLKSFVRKYGRDYVDVTAVVTVTDDGGSSGRLRREFAILPPGDIRNCMVALSEDEALLSKLFQYRFESGRGLAGHSFGNLFLTALTHITGDFTQAIRVSGEILAIHGRIFPSTAKNVGLKAKLMDGSIVTGETNISRSTLPIRTVTLEPRTCRPLPETLEAIAQADLICLGPGSLYTSVVPNLLVKGIPDAIRASTGIKAYFCNIMSQPGETSTYTASMHVDALNQHARGSFLDVVVVNTKRPSEELLQEYALQSAYLIENDFEALEALGPKVIKAELLADTIRVRHNPEVISRIAMELAMMSRADRRMLAARPSKTPAKSRTPAASRR